MKGQEKNTPAQDFPLALTPRLGTLRTTNPAAPATGLLSERIARIIRSSVMESLEFRLCLAAGDPSGFAVPLPDGHQFGDSVTEIGPATPRGPQNPMWMLGPDGEPFLRMPGSPTAYNCHSWALHEGRGDPDDPTNDLRWPRWDNEPADDLDEEDRVDPGEGSQVGDIVVYGNDTDGDGVLDPGEAEHTGVVTSVNEDGQITGVRSKWGDAPLFDHHPLDVPPIYGDILGTYRPGEGNPGSSH